MKQTMKNILSKSTRRFLPFLLSLITLFCSVLTADAYDWIRPKSISAVGSKKLTLNVGQEKKLLVQMNPWHADDDFLRWKIISGKKVIRFTDSDRSDDSIEILALKAGTAKVRCYINGKSSQKVNFTIKVKKASKNTGTIMAKGSKTKYVEQYDDFDLEVKRLEPVNGKYLKWTIANPSIVSFENRYETQGDDVEFIARKPGTTTVTCTNTQTKDKVSFTVKVLNRYDDYDDSDDFWEYYDD